MGFARLVVLEGPDVGVEFQVPLRGGGVGRGEGNAVQLADRTVSRVHCKLEVRGNQVWVVDNDSRSGTYVNDERVTEHALTAGDELMVGRSKLAFLPAPGAEQGPRPGRPSRVTMEIASRELLRAAVTRAGALAPAEGRAERHLSALAHLGDTLRAAADRAAIANAACETAVTALAGDRAFLMLRDGSGGLAFAGAVAVPEDPDGTHLALARDLADKVMSEGKAIAIDAPADGQRGARSAAAAPLSGAGDTGEPIGLLLVDRRAAAGPAFERVDLMALAVVTHLTAAAIEGVDARDSLVRENRALHERLAGSTEFVGRSPAAQHVLGFVAKVAPSDATVLLTGESGSGKEMVAQAIHNASRRSQHPLICVNCAALTETLLESELFGHEKGAFTGATERKIGRFELADKGTLFLDEVGELSASCQTKFLRVLEEQRFERVGGTRSISVDVRVIAATNRDLPDMVRKRAFRDDLFYRLSVIHAVVPPLRARVDDVPMLADYFLAKLRAQVARRVVGFTPEALRALCSYPWPGNVRELRNAVERAIVLGEGELIRVEDLPPDIAAGGARTTPPTAPFAAQRPLNPTPVAGTPTIAATVPMVPGAPTMAKPLRELERDGIVAALAATGGNKAQAAAILQIDRSTLYKKIKEYGIK